MGRFHAVIRNGTYDDEGHVRVDCSPIRQSDDSTMRFTAKLRLRQAGLSVGVLRAIFELVNAAIEIVNR